MEIKQQELELIGLIKDYLNEEVSLSTRFDSMTLDSLEFINLILEISKVLNIDMALEEFLKFETVGDLIDYVSRI